MNADRRRLKEKDWRTRRTSPSSNLNNVFSNLRASAFICGLLLLGSGCDRARQIGEVFSGNTAEKNLLRVQSNNPDERRQGLLFLIDHDFGKEPLYTAVYKQVAQQDKDPVVRATAIRSLNRARDASATKTFITALTDPSPLVRLEAAKALYRLPDPDASEPLLALVRKEDETKDVRIAAAEALQHYRRLDVGRTLITLLNQRDFGLAWQSRRTLKRLTGRDLNYDESAWLQFITGPEKPLG